MAPAKSLHQLQVGTYPVEIIYQDADVLVVNKPAGLVVYAPAGNDQASLLDALRPLISLKGERGGIVHRLDKYTSGVMIVARTKTAETYLKAQFKERKVHKTYLALVEGHVSHAAARLELPLIRQPLAFTRMKVDPAGKLGVLEYRLKNRLKSYDLLEIDLMTGRTHQIRVQLSYLGHPVVGDSVYGRHGKSTVKKSYGLARPFLHAEQLKLQLPSGANKAFSVPLPPELQEFLHNHGQI